MNVSHREGVQFPSVNSLDCGNHFINIRVSIDTLCIYDYTQKITLVTGGKYGTLLICDIRKLEKFYFENEIRHTIEKTGFSIFTQILNKWLPNAEISSF